MFFVRSHFGPPALDRTRKTTFDGLVTTPLTLDVEELRKSFPEVTITAVLQCAGNGRALQKPRVPGVQWLHGAMGQATFTGVRLKDVLTKAGLSKDAQYLRVSGADADPHKVIAVLLAAMHSGLSRRLEPGAQIYGDAALAQYHLEKLPDNFALAKEKMLHSPFVAGYFNASDLLPVH